MGTFSLIPSALSFVFLWHTHTHTHTHSMLAIRLALSFIVMHSDWNSANTRRTKTSSSSMGAVHITSCIQSSMEAILACLPALSTKWLDWVAISCELWVWHMRAPLSIDPIFSKKSISLFCKRSWNVRKAWLPKWHHDSRGQIQGACLEHLWTRQSETVRNSCSQSMKKKTQYAKHPHGSM